MPEFDVAYAYSFQNLRNQKNNILEKIIRIDMGLLKIYEKSN